MRPRTLITAGAATAAVLVAGAVAGVTLTRPDETTASPNPPAQTSTVTTAAVESACGLPGTPGDGTEGANNATWEKAGIVSLPVSKTDGPGKRVPTGPWSCYTRTPSGAVLAGITIALRADGAAENWQDVLRQQTMPGPGQDAALNGPLANAEQVALRGYTVAGYSADRATIRYYLHTPASDASCTTEVQWSGGDWRLVLGDDGSTSSGCAQGAPVEFTPWGP